MSKRIRKIKKVDKSYSSFKVGDFIIGIKASKYSITDAWCICKVIHKEKEPLIRERQVKITKNKYDRIDRKGPFPDEMDSDIIVEVVDVKSKFRQHDTGMKYWVNSKYFVKTNRPRW